MKKPWYTWLSVVGFAGLYFAIAYNIIVKRKPFSFDLWLRCLGRVFALLIGLVMLPIGLMLLIMNLLQGTLTAVTPILTGIILVYLYGSGVYSARNLYAWWSAQASGAAG